MKSIFDILHDNNVIKTPNSLNLDKLFPNESICKDALYYRGSVSTSRIPSFLFIKLTCKMADKK